MQLDKIITYHKALVRRNTYSHAHFTGGRRVRMVKFLPRN